MEQKRNLSVTEEHERDFASIEQEEEHNNTAKTNSKMPGHRPNAFSNMSTSDNTMRDQTQVPREQATKEEIEQLDALLEDEKSHTRQWRKHVLAIFVISISLTVNMVRGSKRTPSIIDIEKCGELDWTIFTSYILISILLSFVGVYINKRE